MASYESANEIRAGDVASMGEPLGELFYLLRTELTWTVWRWHQHKTLFGAEKPTRLEILQKSASFFFWIVQETLWESSVLAVARLAGPSVSVGKQNLSVHRLLPLVSEEIRPALASRLTQLSHDAAWAMDWRNRRIAHRDWQLAIDNAPKPLAPASREALDHVLSQIGGILNEVQRYYRKSTTLYDGQFASNGAETLLYVLRDGLRMEEMRGAQLEEGKYDADLWGDHLPAV